MKIDEFEFQDKNGNEIEPTKNQLVIYIKSLHKQIAELKAENEILKGQVEELNDDNMSLRKKASKEGVEILLDIKQQLKDNTKQVCEKIRENIVKYVYGGNLFDIKGFKEFLDQIENGE